MRVVDKKSFIAKAEMVHGKRYGYRAINYVSSYLKVRILCRRHGYFEQKANNHLSGKGCWSCCLEERSAGVMLEAKSLRAGSLKIISRMGSLVHPTTELVVECPVHGGFAVKAASALKGCHLCHKQEIRLKRFSADLKLRRTAFLKRLKEIYGDQLISKGADYVNAHTPVLVICKDHGPIKSKPYRIIEGAWKGSPCSKCRKTGYLKHVVIGGKEFPVRGYEGLALKHLIESKGFDPNDIVVGNDVPKISINFKRKDGTQHRQHWPDIYIKSLNLLIEVKSTATFGLTTFFGNSDDNIRLICHKSQTAKKQGYDYKVMLFKGQKKNVSRIPLPLGWDSWSVKDIKEWYNETHGE